MVEEQMEDDDSKSLIRLARALSDDIKEIESIDVSGSYMKTISKIKRTRRAKIYNTTMRYAGILVLPLLISVLYLSYLNYNKPKYKVKYAEVTASSGTVVRYELPDHSIVWLNAGSTLRYPTVFDRKSRKVELKGEAYFDVNSDKDSPFYVNTSTGFTVHVYGTQFNISAYEEDNYIETVLEHGKVDVILSESKRTISLNPGERILYNKESKELIKTEVDVYEKTAWKDGKLIFRSTSLSEVLKRMSRHYNVDIVFNNHSGKEYNYWATFRDESLQQALDYLRKSAAMKWRTEDATQQQDNTFTKKRIIVDLY